jgi:hypothetical protein
MLRHVGGLGAVGAGGIAATLGWLGVFNGRAPAGVVGIGAEAGLATWIQGTDALAAVAIGAAAAALAATVALARLRK